MCELVEDEVYFTLIIHTNRVGNLAHYTLQVRLDRRSECIDSFLVIVEVTYGILTYHVNFDALLFPVMILVYPHLVV